MMSGLRPSSGFLRAGGGSAGGIPEADGAISSIGQQMIRKECSVSAIGFRSLLLLDLLAMLHKKSIAVLCCLLVLSCDVVM